MPYRPNPFQVSHRLNPGPSSDLDQALVRHREKIANKLNHAQAMVQSKIEMILRAAMTLGDWQRRVRRYERQLAKTGQELMDERERRRDYREERKKRTRVRRIDLA